MLWETYEKRFIKQASFDNISNEAIAYLLEYARRLHEKSLPIIYDQTHFSLLLGINNEYLHRMSNAPEFFYRTFYIKKRTGRLRRIDEPLPDLKKVQTWILNNLLYKVPCSKFAKAYVPSRSIKDNARFHTNKSIVMTVDLKDFFTSIKSGLVLNLYLSIGYNLQTAVFLTRLCTLNNSLPQGAPTSAYLSNLVMRYFDEVLSKYCIYHKIRYTRYADDLTFSGDFDIAEMLRLIDNELIVLNLARNKRKLKVMRKADRQNVTGVVVNEKQQLSKEYRMKIRQEMHFIEKFGLDNHLEHIHENRKNYLDHLMGKIKYAIFINPKDEKLKNYLHNLQNIDG